MIEWRVVLAMLPVLLYALFLGITVVDGRSSVIEICHLCYCHNTTLDCAHLSLRIFELDPSYDWSWIKTLDLADNSLTEFPDVSQLHNLTAVILSKNSIQHLSIARVSQSARIVDLDLSGNSIDFGAGSIDALFFSAFPALQRLRLKQSVRSSPCPDYSVLSPLNTTLEQLYITGIPVMPDIATFSHLHTLSLGGDFCNITELHELNFSPLLALNLKRLSARNCGIRTVSTQFLSAFHSSLERLDLSCNPIHGILNDILVSLEGSPIDTLILDFINHRPTPCEWNSGNWNTTALFSTKLTKLSVRANHLGSLSDTKIALDSVYLKYINVGQNNLAGAGFAVGGNDVHGRVPMSTKDMYFGTHFPSLRFIGLEALSIAYPCQQYDRSLLKCSEESELFELDNFEWDYVRNPNYLSANVLLATLHHLTNISNAIKPCGQVALDCFRDSQHASLFNFVSFLSGLPLPERCVNVTTDCLISRTGGTERSKFLIYLFSHISDEDIGRKLLNLFLNPPSPQNPSSRISWMCSYWPRQLLINASLSWIYANIAQSNVYVYTNRVTWFYSELCDTNSQLRRTMLTPNTRQAYLLTNLTTLGLSNNVKVDQYLGVCGNTTILYSNLRKVVINDASFRDINCPNFHGLTYLEELEVRNSGVEQINTQSFAYMNLKKVDLAGNLLGHQIRSDPTFFHHYESVVDLKLGGQQDGVEYFENGERFTNMSHLVHLDLSNNGIVQWNVSLSTNTNLKTINLSFNDIKYIETNFRQELEQLYNVSSVVVDLQGNQVRCSCDHESVHYIKWMLSHPMVRPRKAIGCYGQNMTIQQYLLLHSQYCPTLVNSWISQNFVWITMLTSFVVFIIVTTLALYLRGFHNVVTCLHLRNKPQRGIENNTIVYASFSQSMLEQVDVLRLQLENVGVTLTSCHWDGEPGQLRSAALSQRLSQISKCLLVIDATYFTDPDTIQEYRLLQASGFLVPELCIICLVSGCLMTECEVPVNFNLSSYQSLMVEWPAGFCQSRNIDVLMHRIVPLIDDKLDMEPN